MEKIKLIAKHAIQGQQNYKQGDVFEAPLEIAERLIASAAAMRHDGMSASPLTIKAVEVERFLKNCGGAGIIDITPDGSVTNLAVGPIAFTVTYDSTDLSPYIPLDKREARISKILGEVKERIAAAGRSNGYRVTFV